jgi:membrane protease subunit (stomatin/prohibitin family)
MLSFNYHTPIVVGAGLGLFDLNMGSLKQHLSGQFLDVIEWLDDTRDTLAFRFPVMGQAITDKSQLVVREGQIAMFVAEGKLSQVFEPGSYTIGTKNTPLLSFFESILYDLNYPYKGDVYFLSTRQFTANPWGTPNPIMMRDADFGQVQLRGHGTYAYAIRDGEKFLRQMVGTDGLLTIDEINGQLKSEVIAGVTRAIAGSGISALDILGQTAGIESVVDEALSAEFMESYGVDVTRFTVVSITGNEALQEALDLRMKMRVIGDMNTYTKMKTADAIMTAAGNEGIGGAGVGMGVGFGVGNVMAGAIAGAQTGGIPGAPAAPTAAVPPPLPTEARYHYAGPTGQVEVGISQVVTLIQAAPDADHKVWQAGFSGWMAPSDVPEIANRLKNTPPPLPPAGGPPPL